MRANKIFLGVILLAVGALFLHAQGNTGAILGTIVDPSGAVVPGVKIMVFNIETGVASPTTTDGLGNYAVRFLPPGRYRVEAEADGFKKFIRDNVVLDVARELRVGFALETGGLTESVTVTGRASLVETETGMMSTTVESRQVVSLPLLGRDPQKLSLFVAGVVETNSDASGSAGGYSRIVNGGLIRRDVFLVDGANVVNHVYGTNPVNPNPDTVQEFKVLTNSFSAEYGETSGGVMIATTKSGTNDFHGNLYEFFRNDKLNAGNFFTHARPVIRYNQFGGTLGGPIKRNKTFFFASYSDGRDVGTSTYTNLTVPLPDFRLGDFSRVLGAKLGNDVLGRPVYANQIFDPGTARTVLDATGKSVVVRDAFQDNRIPQSRLSPAALKVQALYPQPQINTPYRNYNFSGSKLNYQKYMDLKTDHFFTQNSRVMVRYSKRWFHWLDPQPFPDPGGGGTGAVPGYGYQPGHSATANYVRVFGARATTSLTASWFQHYPHRMNPGYGTVSQNSLGIFGLPNGGEKLGPPLFNFTNYSPLGATALMWELQSRRALSDMTTIVFSRHTIKVGGEATLLRTDNNQPAQNTSWTFSNLFTDQRGFGTSGYDYASFLLGLPRAMSYNIFPDTFRTRTSIYAMFVQDDIRVSRKLTVNIGARWSAPLWFHERTNRSGLFNMALNRYVQFGTSELPRTTPYEQNYKSFEPRFGFAYSPRADNKTVVRGGYGMFHIGVGDTGSNNGPDRIPFHGDQSANRYDATADQLSWRTTLDLVPYVPMSKSGTAYTSISINPDRNPMGYMQQFNLSVGHEIQGILTEVGYVGNLGTHLPGGNYNMNAIPMSLAAEARGRYIAPYVPYPQFPNGVTIRTWIGRSAYHSLQLKAEKRFSAGLGFMSSYTWSKMISSENGGYRDPAMNRQLDRGLDTNSVPQRFTIAWNYEMPLGKGRRWITKGPLVHALGGWELNGGATFQAGFPLTPAMSYNSALTGGVNRPNATRSPELPGNQRTIARWFDVSAFTIPALYTTGNAGRGLIYGPGRQSVNVSLAKRFYGFGSENRNLEVRAEFFNFLNSPNFANPNVTVDSANAGMITATSNERQLQFALKFYF